VITENYHIKYICVNFTKSGKNTVCIYPFCI